MGRNRLRDFFQRQLHDTFHVRTFCRSIGLCFIRTNRIFKRKSSIHHFFYYCRKFSRDRKRNLDLQTSVIVSLEPKSVTTPIALSLSAKSGGIPSLTAITVVICGILGGIIGPFILRKLHIKSRVAKGLALGAAAHGLGTAKAIELGAVEGAISGLAIGLMGIMTSLLIPLVENLFYK